MLVKDILRSLNLGSSVAEHDELLQAHFIETETFRKLVANEIDTVAGDKGTGKAAIYRILARRYTQLEPLNEVEVLPGFNPVGNPVFQRLAEGDPMEKASA
jgi:hypothetical protein